MVSSVTLLKDVSGVAISKRTYMLVQVIEGSVALLVKINQSNCSINALQCMSVYKNFNECFKCLLSLKLVFTVAR